MNTGIPGIVKNLEKLSSGEWAWDVEFPFGTRSYRTNKDGQGVWMYGADGQPQQITGTIQFSLPNSKQRAMYALKKIWEITETSKAAGLLGSIITDKKSAAARINGKLGGRPRKS